MMLLVERLKTTSNSKFYIVCRNWRFGIIQNFVMKNSEFPFFSKFQSYFETTVKISWAEIQASKLDHFAWENDQCVLYSVQYRIFNGVSRDCTRNSYKDSFSNLVLCFLETHQVMFPSIFGFSIYLFVLTLNEILRNPWRFWEIGSKKERTAIQLDLAEGYGFKSHRSRISLGWKFSEDWDE